MRLTIAQVIAERLVKRWSPPTPDGEATGFIAGSIRRGKAEPRDIELVLPLPRVSDNDPVHERIRKDVIGFHGMYGQGLFAHVKGLKPNFRGVTLRCEPATMWGKPMIPPFQVDIFRYVPGPEGNLGMVQLVRTGSAEFSKAAVTWWKHKFGGRMEHNFLIDDTGRVAPTPDEKSAFSALGLRWIEPSARCGRGDLMPVRAEIGVGMGVGGQRGRGAAT